MELKIDFKEHPNCLRGHNYALGVVSGSILACENIRYACQRYLRDLEEGKYPFDADKAEKFLRLVQRFNHIKGEWRTPNLVFEPWQCWIFMNIMGFTNPATGYRRFREAYIEVPRGNGKSAMISAASLFFLALDNPKGNEISCFANKQDQARIVLDSARAMARANKNYLKATGVEVLAHTIKHDKSNSIMRARSSDHGSLDGLNDILSVIDELHAVSRGLYDVVVSGMKKRRDSLLLCITTAGFNMEGPGYAQGTYAKKVARMEMEDDQLFAAIYTIDEGDDIFEESTWRKSNPNYDISVDPITFQAAAKKASEMPSELANFKTKHLNIWVSEARAYFNIVKWKENAKDIKLEDFKGKKCIIGLDLASKVDLTSIGILFREGDKYYFFDKSYVPEQTVLETKNSLYDNCIGKGALIATKGEAIHYPHIKEEILNLKKNFNILELLYDPWNASEMAQSLALSGINMVEFRMNTANLSEPTKRLDALIREGKFYHNGSPLLTWCLGNVICKEDAAGNVFPRKSDERLKIDPIITMIMALASYIQKETKETVYETRGIRFL